VPVPDSNFPTLLDLPSSDPETIARDIVLFAAYMPSIIQVMKTERLDSTTVATGVFLKLLPDCSLEMSWFTNRPLARRTRLLKLEDIIGDYTANRPNGRGSAGNT
jgi:hypothetical protein